MKGVISMSTREADRVGIIQRLVNREIRQRHAAKIMWTGDGSWIIYQNDKTVPYPLNFVKLLIARVEYSTFIWACQISSSFSSYKRPWFFQIKLKTDFLKGTFGNL